MATTGTDVAWALTNLHEKIAKDIESTPTGVTPGYNPLVGATILPNGKLRYAREGASPFMVDAIYTMSTTNTVLGDTTPKRLNFNHQIHDPLSQVTTGASWAFTAAAAGAYIVLVSAPLSIADGTPWVTADRADLTIQGDVSGTVATWTGIGVTAQPGELRLDGVTAFALAAGDVIYTQMQQDCGTDRDVDDAIAIIVIGHV